MLLKFLKLTNFRNHLDFKHRFERNLSLLVGPNTSGKTNILEAIKLLAFSKSLRAKSDADLINFNKDFTKVEGLIEKEKDQTKLEVVIDASKKENSRSRKRYQKIIRIDDISGKKASDLLGHLLCVSFSPEDLNLIYDPPYFRRRYLDIILCQINKHYCFHLSEYKKVLFSRNKLLSEIKKGSARKSELDFWNNKLVDLGVKIIEKRSELISSFNLRLGPSYQKISADSNSKLNLKYLANIPFKFEDKIKEAFLKRLNLVKEKEIFRGKTLIGPQKDNFIFKLNDKNLALFGSRGEARSALCALKDAELDFLQQKTKIRPLLLLDDVLSELDKERAEQIRNIVQKQQTIIASTDINRLPSDLQNKAEIIELKT